MWAGTYDEDMREVFALQPQIAERVARELDIALLEPERRNLEVKPTDNLEAYEYYLKGIEHGELSVNEEDALLSIEMYKKAVELDSRFALAWAHLSRAYTWKCWMFEDSQSILRAREAADKAMLIDPGLLEGHLALGFIYYYGKRDYDRALEHFHKCLMRRESIGPTGSGLRASRTRI